MKGKNDYDGVISGDGYKQSFDNPAKWSQSLVPYTIIRWIARVLMFGAKKYARGQWMRGMAFSGMIDAAHRHIAAWESGEDIDPESGLPHLAHAATNLAFLSWMIDGPDAEAYRKFDDRLFIGSEKLRARNQANNGR